MSLPEWSVKNRVAVNLFAVVLLVAGLTAAGTRLKLDLFPDVSSNFISVVTLDPITSIPEEIERTITIPIEEELADVSNVAKVTSYSEENFSTIFVEVDAAITDIDPILNEVRQAVDKAKSEIPSSAEPPVIQEFEIPLPLITFTVSYPAGYDVMQIRTGLDRIKRQLKIIPGVSDVLVDGLDRREVWIEVDPFRLQTAGVSFQDVQAAVSRKNLNVVGGKMDAAGGQRLVRLLGEIQSAEDLADLPIKESDGSVTLLRDVATFKDRTEEPRTLGRSNLQPAVTYTVVKKRGADAIKTVAAVRRVFEEEAKNLPPEVETQALADSTKFIRIRINTVLQNGLQALLLVTVLLILFLNWRLGLMVAIGIPISFAGTFLVLYMGGFTINLLSLFAMIMALGMVVDDAIVIAENAYRYMQQGLSPAKAAVRGANEVFWPVVGSVSTTVAAFLPLIWGEGIIGKFLVIVPVVVISTLFFSLVQAFIVLPSHLADFVRTGATTKQIQSRKPARGPIRGLMRLVELTYAEIRETVDAALSVVVQIYTHLLVICLRWRYAVLCGFLLLPVALVAAFSTGIIRFKLFDTDFADRLTVKLEMPADSTLLETGDAVALVEQRIADQLPPDDLTAIVTRIGARLNASDQFLEYGTQFAMITVDIDEENPDCRKPSVIERDLRRILAEFPTFVSATANREEGGPPVGKAVNIEISGSNFADLELLAAEVEDRLATIPGVVNPANDFPRGKTEFRVVVDEARAARAGVDSTDIGRALQAGFRGLETNRLRWGNEEVIVRVKTAERFRQDPELLKGLRLIARDGGTVPLASVATIERQSGTPRISRLNQERVITVSADLDERSTTSTEANAVIAGWVPELLEGKQGVTIALTGENEDTERSLEAMKFATLVAIMLIYALLAVITNSFMQPLVIMSVIPFGVVGVAMGLIFMGQTMGLMSIMGTIALAGIVVNNSVVFVDFINRYRHESLEGEASGSEARHQPFTVPPLTRWRSVIQCGRVRFRPVFLTTATTVAGLSNLAFTSTGQEQFLAPMALAIVWGLSFASTITLILIPCLYSALDDAHLLIDRLRGNPTPTEESPVHVPL